MYYVFIFLVHSKAEVNVLLKLLWVNYLHLLYFTSIIQI